MSSSTGGTALASGQGANTIHSLAGLGRGYGSGEALYEAMPAAARKRWRDVQIMKVCKQRVSHLDMHEFRGIAVTAGSSQEGAAGNLQVTADEAHVAAVQSDVSLQTDRNTQKAVLFKCCTALDVVAVELTQLQHLNKFTLTERPHQVMYNQMAR
ncbi:TPA: hypothetical protein ACH3X2_006817 [Trebouxia sp. C0005]